MRDCPWANRTLEGDVSSDGCLAYLEVSQKLEGTCVTVIVLRGSSPVSQHDRLVYFEAATQNNSQQYSSLAYVGDVMLPDSVSSCVSERLDQGIDGVCSSTHFI
jgi:hypothetical protein